jgi:hypothetical protein
MSTQGEKGRACRWQRQALLPGTQLGGNRQSPTGGVTGEGDVGGADPLLKQPAVGGGRVVDLRWMGVLRGEPVVEDQRADASGLGQMGEQLPVCKDRAADEPAAMDAQQDAVLRTFLRCHPHPRHAAGIGFDVVNPARLPRQVTPVLVVLVLAIEPGVRPANVELPHRF